ncbi:MAG: hypothetical protein ACKVWR_01905 [Acidimicrobiales bacterium]
MPRRRTQLGATTTHRYQWMIDNYINPRIGDIPLRALRVLEHIDQPLPRPPHARQPHAR